MKTIGMDSQLEKKRNMKWKPGFWLRRFRNFVDYRHHECYQKTSKGLGLPRYHERWN